MRTFCDRRLRELKPLMEGRSASATSFKLVSLKCPPWPFTSFQDQALSRGHQKIERGLQKHF
jgi:hypothetical protein